MSQELRTLQIILILFIHIPEACSLGKIVNPTNKLPILETQQPTFQDIPDDAILAVHSSLPEEDPGNLARNQETGDQETENQEKHQPSVQIKCLRYCSTKSSIPPWLSLNLNCAKNLIVERKTSIQERNLDNEFSVEGRKEGRGGVIFPWIPL